MSVILLLDDDEQVLRSYARILGGAGFEVVTAGDAREAVQRLAGHRYDAIVSDVSMPGVGGLDLLRAVRQRDLDVPVILMSGSPTLQDAIRAVDDGAFRWLEKPVAPEALVDAVRRATQFHRLAVVRRQALALAAVQEHEASELAELGSQFEAALAGLWMAFQPIVSLRERRAAGYEALLRTSQATLARPDRFLEAAEKLGRLDELGRRVRAACAAAASDAPDGVWIFVNLHPTDLLDEQMYDAAAPLSLMAPRTILEITERASLAAVTELTTRIGALRKLGFRIALDDLGAGYAGLTSLAQLEPELVKLDMSLVRGIRQQPAKQTVVRTMVKLCDEMGMTIVAEGVETEEERDTMADMGCDLLQGYLFARPGPGFPAPAL